jgi:hypothetical protein
LFYLLPALLNDFAISCYPFSLSEQPLHKLISKLPGNKGLGLLQQNSNAFIFTGELTQDPQVVLG